MKKTLVATAALAATSAFAQVTITGIMDAGYQTGKEYGQDAKTVVQNGSRTTAIKFIGVEDLGGGLKAKFQFEADPAITAANGNNNNGVGTAAAVALANNTTAQVTGQASAQSGLVGNGYNYVMLESATLGSIEFGTINTATLSTQGLGAQKFGTAIGSGYKKIWADLTRFENSWAYKSPTIGGFSASYLSGIGNDSQYGSTTTVTLRRPAVSEIGLNFDQGPVSVKYANLSSTAASNDAATTTTTNITGASVKTTYNTFAATYDFGVAKVGYGYQTTKSDGGLDASGYSHAKDQKASMYTLSVPAGNVVLMANVGSRQTNNAGSAYERQLELNGKKSTFSGLGAHYNFSKNTYAYYMYERANMADAEMSSVIINGAAGVNTTSSRSRNVTAIGISSAF